MKNSKAKNQFLALAQKYLFVSTVRDDTIVLKNGGLRAVLMTSSINFSLKNEDEQKGLLQGYISLLNSIDFPIQIVVQSRKLNIDDYLVKIDKRIKEVQNELLRLQLIEYKKYIVELLTIGEIMSKKFYVVVPYEPGSSGKKGFFTQLSEVFTSTNVISLSKQKFEQYSGELERRVSLVQSALGGMGLKAVRLDTQGLIELLYNSYNPRTSDLEKMTDINQYNLEQ